MNGLVTIIFNFNLLYDVCCISSFLARVVNDSEMKKEKERDELWKQLDQLKLDHDKKKSSSSVSTTRPHSRRAPPKSVLSSSGFPKSSFSAKSL